MISGAKATLRIAEPSCTFWQPVSIHTVRLHLKEKKLDYRFKLLPNNWNRALSTLLLHLTDLPVVKSCSVGNNTAIPRRFCLLLHWQWAEIDLNFVHNGIGGLVSCSGLCSFLQGSNLRWWESKIWRYKIGLGGFLPGLSRMRKKGGAGFICQVFILNFWAAAENALTDLR